MKSLKAQAVRMNSRGGPNRPKRPGPIRRGKSARHGSWSSSAQFILGCGRIMVWTAVITVGAWVALQAYWRGESLLTDWFLIRDVTVTGANHVDRDDVMERLKLRTGETLFSIDSSGALTRLTSHSWIKEATISRIPFHTLAVHLVERQPVAVFKTASLDLLVDEEGHVLSVVDSTESQDLPVILGMEPKSLIRGEARSRETVRAGIELAGLVGQVFKGRPKVDVRNPLNLVASVEKVRFQFGSSPFEKKWNLYQRVRPALGLTEGDEANKAVGEIDLRYPRKVIVRERG